MRHREDRLQTSCVRWFDLQYPEYRLLLHHSPNGGFRTEAEGRVFKAMGTRAGFPDLILLLPRHGFTALAIELKTDKGQQRETQKVWQRVAEVNGIRYLIVRSFDEFYKVINEYLS